MALSLAGVSQCASYVSELLLRLGRACALELLGRLGRRRERLGLGDRGGGLLAGALADLVGRGRGRGLGAHTVSVAVRARRAVLGAQEGLLPLVVVVLHGDLEVAGAQAVAVATDTHAVHVQHVDAGASTLDLHLVGAGLGVAELDALFDHPDTLSVELDSCLVAGTGAVVPGVDVADLADLDVAEVSGADSLAAGAEREGDGNDADTSDGTDAASAHEMRLPKTRGLLPDGNCSFIYYYSF